MYKLVFSLLLIFDLFVHKKSQAQDSSHIKISLLTCSPGDELYSTFGHTALRITDSIKQTDIVFNYGYFNFNEPNFYLKFIKGKLNYWLEPEQFNDFLTTYIEEKRSIQEQKLSLSFQEKQIILQTLAVNLEGSNRYYKYNFLLDNCTTRIRDLLFKHVKKISVEKIILAEHVTSRNLIHNYLDRGGKPWSKLGIDILLGSELDKPLTNQQIMFLPEYLMKGIDNSTTNNLPFVTKKSYLINFKPSVVSTSKYEALMVISCISIILFFVYFFFRKHAVIIRLLDSIFLVATGLLGMFLLFMWFGTDHTVCQKNFNLLWAMPLNMIVAFLIWKPCYWIRFYFGATILLNVILLAFWFWLPQKINNDIIPIIVFMLFRYKNNYEIFN